MIVGKHRFPINGRRKMARKTAQRAVMAASGQISRSGPLQLALYKELEKNRVLFVYQKPIVSRSAGSFRVVDFWFPRGKELCLAVDVWPDGRAKQETTKRRRAKWIAAKTGAKHIAIPESEVEQDVQSVVKKLCENNLLFLS